MIERKFTPPTEFPAEYVDRNGNKAVILGRGPAEEVPFIGYNSVGDPQCWTELGKYYIGSTSPYDLQDIPDATTELEQAEARIEELEGRLASAVDVLLEGVEPSELKEGEAETKKYHDAWHKAEAKVVELEAKLEKVVEALQSMPEAVEDTTLDDGPLWPEERIDVWLATLHACKNVVQSKVDQTLTELKGQDDE